MNLISFWKRVGLSNNSFFREVLSGKGPKFSACSWKWIVNRHKVIFFWKLPLQIWAIGAIVGSREGPGYPTISIYGYCKCNFRSWVTIVSAICSCDLSYYGGFENWSNFHKICSPGNGKHLRFFQNRAEPIWSAIHTRLRERGWLNLPLYNPVY